MRGAYYFRSSVYFVPLAAAHLYENASLPRNVEGLLISVRESRTAIIECHLRRRENVTPPLSSARSHYTTRDAPLKEVSISNLALCLRTTESKLPQTCKFKSKLHRSLCLHLRKASANSSKQIFLAYRESRVGPVSGLAFFFL